MEEKIVPIPKPENSLDPRTLQQLASLLGQLLQQVENAGKLVEGASAGTAGERAMVRMGPKTFKTLVGMAQSFQDLTSSGEVSPTEVREAQVMAGLSAM